MTFRLALAVLCCLVVLPCSGAAADERPNVLFIAVDDLNDWIGCMKGHPQAQTPNMDRLAARGVLFANAHCAAPACNPSRAAVFSGRMPRVTGVWSNGSGTLDRRYPQARLLPKALADSGYRVLGTGKLLHSGGRKAFHEYFGVGQRWSPLSKDAVRYSKEELPSKGSEDPRHVVEDRRGREIVLPLNRMPSDRRPDANDGESFDWGPFDVPDAHFGDTQITDWAIEKLVQEHSAPLFLAVGYYRPHIPLWTPKRFFDRFAATPAELPPFKADDLDDLSREARRWALEPVTAGSHATVVRHGQWRAAIEAYLACVTYVDYEIGRLLDALDASPIGDNTAIVLWSDHGWHLGEKQHWGKWTGWERSTKVPLIIVPPKTSAGSFARGGSRCDQPVGLIDLYPTLTEICRAEGPTALDGKSLVPLLRDPGRSTSRAVLTMFDAGNASLRTERWRYIRYADGSEELYDHRLDPNEWNNLAAADGHEAQIRSLRQRLADCGYVAPEPTESARLFRRLDAAPWREVFSDPCTGDWRDRWTLDGLKANVTNTPTGMKFTAGPTRGENASHAVLWTKESFEGDIRLDYEYTKLDDATEAVTILFLQATGSGAPGYDKDISRWADRRQVPAMKTYFNHMHLHHISYAAFDIGNTNARKDYIRARRYMPESGKGLAGTGLKPDYSETGLFRKGALYRITVIKKGDDLLMRIRDQWKAKLCHWKTDALPPILEGRVGLRHMWTRSARYRDFRISRLDVRR